MYCMLVMSSLIIVDFTTHLNSVLKEKTMGFGQGWNTFSANKIKASFHTEMSIIAGVF